MTTANFNEKYGPWALVTGAAEGLGLAFANHIAGEAMNVILVDVQMDKAKEQAARIAKEYGVQTKALACDLAESNFIDGLTVDIKGYDIGLLICCAGIGVPGAFLDVPLSQSHKTVQINCLSTMTLCHHLAPPMIKRGRGGIVVIASNSGYAGAWSVA